MKVLFTIPCLSYGGAEKNMVLVANYLSQKGHSIAICSFNEEPKKQQLHPDIRCYDMPVQPMGKGRFAWVGVRKRQYAFLEQTCKKEQPEVILSFLPISNALAVLCGKKMHIPVVISERADPYQAISKLDRLMHALYNRADGAVFQTEGAKKFYAPRLQKKSAVIPNPVILKEQDISYDLLACKPQIAFVGRFELKQKRQDIMLRAMRKVIEKHPQYTLVFYGDGPDKPAMQDFAAKLGIDQSVVFAGVSTQVLKDISQSEIFAMTSDYEGIPNVLIEAMSIGMPCVATDCSPGGARLLLRGGEDGMLVPCGDVEAIVSAINTLIEDKRLAADYGKKAKGIIDRFNYDTIMEKWESYLSQFQR